MQRPLPTESAAVCRDVHAAVSVIGTDRDKLADVPRSSHQAERVD